MTIHKCVVFAAAVATVSLAASSLRAATAVVSSKPAQTIKGWGVFPSFDNGLNADENIFKRPAIQDAIYGMGISFVRVELWNGYYKSGGASVGDVVLSTTPGNAGVSGDIGDLVVKMKNARAHHISQIIMSCWSPPPSMKTLASPDGTAPGAIAGYVDLNGNGKSEPEEWSFLRRDKEQAYCNFYVAALLYLQAHGAGLPDFISVQNEPSVSFVTYQACRMEADQWQRIVKTMRATLDANGLQKVGIQAPDDTYSASVTLDWSKTPHPPGYLRTGDAPTLDFDADLGKALASYAFHTYDTGFQSQAIENVTKHPKPIWMTEWNDESKGDGGDNTSIGFAISSARRLSADLTLMPTQYWCWWVAWHKTADPAMGSTLIAGDQTPVLSKKYRFLKSLWTTVRPGWKFCPVNTDDPDLALVYDQFHNARNANMAAFQNAGGTASVVLLVNSSALDKTGFLVRGLKGTSVSVSQITATNDGEVVQSGPVAKGAFTLHVLPARSITLLKTR